MADRRKKNMNWCVADEQGDNYSNMRDGTTLAVLMDIRDELQAMRPALVTLGIRLNCSETLAIPRMLRRISANTHKPKRRRKTVAK